MSRDRDALARWQRAIAPLGGTPVGSWFFRNVARRVDPWLMRRTGGRLTMAGPAPVLTLTATGRRSGQPRSTPLLYFRHGEDYVVVASNYGRPRHPAWFHNVEHDPDVEVEVRGTRMRCTARVAAGAERDELWRRATEHYAGYRGYERQARGRTIPLVVLSPRPGPRAA